MASRPFGPIIASPERPARSSTTTPTGLAGYLRERGLARVVLVGLATDFCVRYSAEDARRLGFEAVLVAEGCRAIDLAGSLEAGMAALRSAGVLIVDRAGDIS